MSSDHINAHVDVVNNMGKEKDIIPIVSKESIPPTSLSNVVNQEQQVGSGSVQGEQQKNKKSKTQTSEVWKIFTRVVIDGKEKAKCNGCAKVFSATSSSGTSHLHRHAKACPGVAKYHDVGLMLLDKEANLRSRQIDNKCIRDLLALCIIEHDLPYSFVEYKWVKELLKTCNPDVQLVSRRTIMSDVWKIYLNQKEKLKQSLLKSPSKICLTSDCWTSITSEGYICLTAHFIDDNWKLNSKILSFCKMEPPYSGYELARKVYDYLVEWSIEKKIFSITLDNASVNDNMQDMLKQRLSNQNNLVCNGEFFHVRCCAHILNLIVQEGLKVAGGALHKIRESIKYVKASEARMICFRQSVEEVGGIDISLGLKLDVPTRWNSTYAMLESAIRYRRAFSTLTLNDINYKVCPSDDEWRRAEKICIFLRPFEVITRLISGSSYPTSNMYFMQISRIEFLLKQYSMNEDELIKGMAQSMQEKFEKYWRDYSIILALGTIFDPRMKLEGIEYSYSMLDPTTSHAKVENIKKKLYFIYDHYKGMSESSSNVGDGSNSNQTVANQLQLLSSAIDDMDYVDDAFNDYITFKSKDVTSFGKSEVDFYLEERTLDVLGYWRNNQHQFPTISKMAFDIFSIPITTVASESAFSIGSRILTKYRSCLLPTNVEALICTRNWMRGFEFTGGGDEDDEEEIPTIDLKSIHGSNSDVV